MELMVGTKPYSFTLTSNNLNGLVNQINRLAGNPGHGVDSNHLERQLSFAHRQFDRKSCDPVIRSIRRYQYKYC